MHLYGIQKDGTGKPVCRTGIEMQTESGHEGTEGKGEGEVNRETRTDTSALLCVKQTASGRLLCSTRTSAWCSVMT